MVWGRNGHLQTLAYGAFGRAKRFSLPYERHSVQLVDGGTSTFDVFWAENHHSLGDFTIAICPGIANSSESAYVRTFVKSAGTSGFRCAVLNHLGALRSVKLTSNRIFTYGKQLKSYGVVMGPMNRQNVKCWFQAGRRSSQKC